MKLQDKADDLRNTISTAADRLDDFTRDLERGGINERIFPSLKRLRTEVLRANAKATDLTQHIEKM